MRTKWRAGDGERRGARMRENGDEGRIGRESEGRELWERQAGAGSKDGHEGGERVEVGAELMDGREREGER